VQRGAAAIYSPEGKRQVRETIDFYLTKRQDRAWSADETGLRLRWCECAYVWLKTPGNLSSWDFFDKLLQQAHLVGTPGAVLEPAGRAISGLSAFNSRANVEEAVSVSRKSCRASGVIRSNSGAAQLAFRFHCSQRANEPKPASACGPA